MQIHKADRHSSVVQHVPLLSMQGIPLKQLVCTDILANSKIAQSMNYVRNKDVPKQTVTQTLI